MKKKKKVWNIIRLVLLAILVTTIVVTGINGKREKEQRKAAAQAEIERAAVAEELEARLERELEEKKPKVDAENCRDAFQKGNDAYDAEDWEMAEEYYLLAEALGEEEDSSLVYDVRNNCGLALLQQGRNEEALSLYEQLIEDVPGMYGYWMNYLVAGHGCGKTAEELLSSENAKDVLNQLYWLSEDEPGLFRKGLYGMYYNIAYMDMELDGFGEDTTRYDPLMNGEMGTMYLMDELPGMSKTETTEFLTMVLMDLSSELEEIYGEVDEDVESLLMYLLAKDPEVMDEMGMSDYLDDFDFDG